MWRRVGPSGHLFNPFCPPPDPTDCGYTCIDVTPDRPFSHPCCRPQALMQVAPGSALEVRSLVVNDPPPQPHPHPPPHLQHPPHASAAASPTTISAHNALAAAQRHQQHSPFRSGHHASEMGPGIGRPNSPVGSRALRRPSSLGRHAHPNSPGPASLGANVRPRGPTDMGYAPPGGGGPAAAAGGASTGAPLVRTHSSSGSGLDRRRSLSNAPARAGGGSPLLLQLAASRLSGRWRGAAAAALRAEQQPAAAAADGGAAADGSEAAEADHDHDEMHLLSLRTQSTPNAMPQARHGAVAGWLGARGVAAGGAAADGDAPGASVIRPPSAAAAESVAAVDDGGDGAGEAQELLREARGSGAGAGAPCRAGSTGHMTDVCLATAADMVDVDPSLLRAGGSSAGHTRLGSGSAVALSSRGRLGSSAAAGNGSNGSNGNGSAAGSSRMASLGSVGLQGAGAPGGATLSFGVQGAMGLPSPSGLGSGAAAAGGGTGFSLGLPAPGGAHLSGPQEGVEDGEGRADSGEPEQGAGTAPYSEEASERRTDHDVVDLARRLGVLGRSPASVSSSGSSGAYGSAQQGDSVVLGEGSASDVLPHVVGAPMGGVARMGSEGRARGVSSGPLPAMAGPVGVTRLGGGAGGSPLRGGAGGRGARSSSSTGVGGVGGAGGPHVYLPRRSVSGGGVAVRPRGFSAGQFGGHALDGLVEGGPGSGGLLDHLRSMPGVGSAHRLAQCTLSGPAMGEEVEGYGAGGAEGRE